MGMAIFSPTVSRPPVLALLLAPFHDLLVLLGGGRSTSSNATCASGQHARPHLRHSTCALDKAPWRNVKTTAAASQPRTSHQTPIAMASSPAPSRLKVVRAFDPGMAPSCAGRMVISGRMADVCAELDRMSQKDTSIQAQ